LAVLIISCKQTKNVPQDKYLLKKNHVEVKGDKLDKEDLEEIIRQPANFKTIGFKLKLLAYNAMDSSNVAEKRIRKNEKIDKTNSKRQARQQRINQRRIDRSRRKGDSLYTKRYIALKDTMNPRLFLREWLKYKFGEPPVIFDSTAFAKTIEQHGNYLKKKGYYFGSNSGEVKYNRFGRKASITYSLQTGELYFIDSVYTLATNPSVASAYELFKRKDFQEVLVGKPFDRDLLEGYRERLAKEFRDNGFYEFSPSHIHFIADTNNQSMSVTLGIRFSERQVFDPNNKDSVINVRHQTHKIRNVYFHISDTTNYSGNFNEKVKELGLQLYDGQYLVNIDTLHYNATSDKDSSDFDIRRNATFLFNGEMFVNPAVIESQNYLEQTHYYKEYYIDRTYTRLLQLGLFQSIEPKLIEVENTNLIDVHYYLVPSSKQSYGIEPRASNSNGFLGVSASINYVNKNLFGGAEKLTLALTGGFESQPPVFDPNTKDELLEQASRSFNTFDIGPSFILDIPGLFPTRITALSKRHRPRTVISGAYNVQKRDEFTRNTFQANYLWKMFVSKTQIFQYGLPGLSLVKYVNITKTESFENQINQFNDLFLRNAYSDQLIWQDWKFVFEFDNKDQDNKTSKRRIYYVGSFDPVGNLVSLFKGIQDTNELGRYQIFGVPYSQFMRIDNDFNFSVPFNKKTSFHFRALAGAGVPNGNKQTSLPFDYSFFAGGSNDNRGWRARSLGPGDYKYILDTNRTVTQIGDVRIGGSAEFRFSLGPTLKGAVFMDAGNIWTIKEDKNRLGSQFTKDWVNQLAYSGGFGVRFDLDFFIVRLDFGIPINNHTLPVGSRWIWQSRDNFNQELIATFGQENLDRLQLTNKIPKPFEPRLHFGIGYPF
jgi:outer membrane protein insertion porin family